MNKEIPIEYINDCARKGTSISKTVNKLKIDVEKVRQLEKDRNER